jgi:hypothetical protein
MIVASSFAKSANNSSQSSDTRYAGETIVQNSIERIALSARRGFVSARQNLDSEIQTKPLPDKI